MNGYELKDHIKSKTPFIVYGDVCKYDPAIHDIEPHEWYRAEIRRASIAVNIETTDEYYQQRDKYRLECERLQGQLTAALSALSALLPPGVLLTPEQKEAIREFAPELLEQKL